MSGPRRPIRRRRGARGYTIIEVISAMTLFAIGAAGVISMQRVTIQGGTDARRFDVASNIANEWAFRLQRDSMFWTEPNGNDPDKNNLTTRTKWLKDITATPGWITPPIPAAGLEGAVSPAFDVFGRDLPASSPTTEHMFCVQYRLEWIADPGTPQPNVNVKLGAIMRAEVRVYWSRLDHQVIGDCAAPTNPLPKPSDATAPNVYHFVYVTTAIRQNPDK